MPKNNRVLWVGLKTLFVGLMLFFLCRTLLTQWGQIASFSWRFCFLPLVASIVLQLIATFFWATIWCHIVGHLLEYPLGWMDGALIYILSNLFKYVPGSVWGYISRAYLGSDKGLDATAIGVSTLWEVGITVVASLLLSGITILNYLNQIDRWLLYLLLVIALLCFCGLLPPIFSWWIHLLTRRYRADRVIPFRWQEFWLYLAAALETHILVGISFFLFAYSFTDISSGSMWSFVGIWSFSTTSGLVIILAPYGIGVREGILASLLQIFVPPGVATLISLASRLWTICSELLAALMVLALSRVYKHWCK